MRRFLVVAVVAVGVLLCQVAVAAPLYLRLSIPEDGSTGMNVTWNTNFNVGTQVQFGTAPGEYTRTVDGASFEGPGELGWIHEVQLTGLEPNTTYYYIAGSAGDSWSEEASFRTAPETNSTCGTFSFGYLGDNRPDETLGGGENYPEILDQLAQRDPWFVLNGGDMVIDGDQIDQWIDFLDWTTIASPELPYMPCIGNHDDGPVDGDGAYYNQIFQLPRSTGDNGSGTEDYYYFTYGNALFVSLSTQTYRGASNDFAEQAAWLDEVLTANPRMWTIVFYHHPTYTTEVLFDISHEPNEQGQNAAFVEVIDRHHVDLVITSHNHWYERYEPSACGTQGDPGSDEPCPVGANNFASGTAYVVSGGAGAFTIPGILCDTGGFGGVDGRVMCAGPHHYIHIEIENNELRYEAWDTDADQLLDAFSITKAAVECEVMTGDEDLDAGGMDTGEEMDAGGMDMDTGEEMDAGGEDVEEDLGEPDTEEDVEPSDDATLEDDTAEDDATTGEDTEGSGEPSTDTGSSGRDVGTPASNDSGCSCSTREGRTNRGWLVACVALVLGLRRRRR